MAEVREELPPWLDRVLACGEHQELGRDPSCEDCREVVGATAYLFELMSDNERVWTARHLRRLADVMNRLDDPQDPPTRNPGTR